MHFFSPNNREKQKLHQQALMFKNNISNDWRSVSNWAVHLIRTELNCAALSTLPHPRKPNTAVLAKYVYYRMHQQLKQCHCAVLTCE